MSFFRRGRPMCLPFRIFNDYFVSRTQLDASTTHTFPNVNARSVPALESIQVYEREVLSILNSLDAKKSTGPDEIPTKLLKFAAVLISEPLTKLFNKSLEQGIFPKTWKTVIIKPIFKNIVKLGLKLIHNCELCV